MKTETKDLSKFTDKAETLAEKMNRLTGKFTEHLDIAEELHVTGSDVIECVQEKTKDISLYKEDDYVASQIVNLDNMISDFKYVRETLKENIENGRRVLNSITLDLLSADEESRASLVVAFAELNKAIADNTKIYLSSYKNIAEILLNLDKIKKKEKEIMKSEGSNTYNELHIHNDAPISTVDLIKQLSNKSE